MQQAREVDACRDVLRIGLQATSIQLHGARGIALLAVQRLAEAPLSLLPTVACPGRDARADGSSVGAATVPGAASAPAGSRDSGLRQMQAARIERHFERQQVLPGAAFPFGTGF